MSDDTVHHPAHPCGRCYTVEATLENIATELALLAAYHGDTRLKDHALTLLRAVRKLRTLRHDLSLMLP